MLVFGGIDLVQNIQLLRRGVHILGDDAKDAAHAAEVVVRAGVNGLVFRVVGVQAVRLIFLDKALARDDENADFARIDLLREFHQQLVAVVKGGCHTVAGRLLRLSQLTGGFVGNDADAVTEQVSSAKLDALSDLLDSAENDGHKVVVIARFLPEIHAIEKLLEKKGLRYSVIHGGVTDRPAQIEAFQNDPEVQVFVGQIATAGLGITLTAASTMIFYSLDYSMSNYEQTRARIHRVGQKHPCTYIHLVAKGTVDEKVLKALQDKANLAKALVDDYRAGRNPFGG